MRVCGRHILCVHTVAALLLLDGKQVSERALCLTLGLASSNSSHGLTRCLYNLCFPPFLWLAACHQLQHGEPGHCNRADGGACHIFVRSCKYSLFLRRDSSFIFHQRGMG